MVSPAKVLLSWICDQRQQVFAEFSLSAAPGISILSTSIPKPGVFETEGHLESSPLGPSFIPRTQAGLQSSVDCVFQNLLVSLIHPWRRDRLPTPVFLGFPDGSNGKESACIVGDLGSIPGLGRFPGEGMATHSSILAWRILWIEEPCGLELRLD